MDNNKVDIFSNRLKKAMDLRNIKAVSLAEKSGVDKSKISSYLSGRYKANQDTLFILANALNVSPSWLMGYAVPIEPITPIKDALSLNFNTKLKKTLNNNVFPLPDEPKRLPVIGKISAGLPILAVENIIDYAFAPASYIKNNYNYFYLLVQGDSMNRKFDDGDYILVQQQDTLENDEIGVFLIEDEATVKRYKAEDGIIKLFPMSTNPKHEAQFYNPEKVDFKIIGKVISYQGKV